MPDVVIGSQNPVKVACTKRAFEKVFPQLVFNFVGSPTESGVSDQPMSDMETLMGAKNRATYAMKKPSGGRFLGRDRRRVGKWGGNDSFCLGVYP